MTDYRKTSNVLPPPFTDETLIRKICEMRIPAKVDITLKFNELPKARFGAGTAAFAVEADGRVIMIELKRKNWLKLETAVAEWPEWVAVISGKMGPEIEGGFMLREAGLQVFEKKPKPPKDEPATTPAPENHAATAVESTLEVAPSEDATIYPKLKLKSKKLGG